MQNVVRATAVIYIIAGSFYFGVVTRPVEMGLAIVAGSIALAFSHIDKIRKFRGAGFEAEMRDKVESMVAKETEPPKELAPSTFAFEALATDPDTDAVVKALGVDRYTWRYLGGIREDSGLSREKVERALDWLTSNGLATQTHGARGPVWGLSPHGRTLLATIQARSKPTGAEPVG